MNYKALLNELNKRKAGGEETLVIRNQRIVKKSDSDTLSHTNPFLVSTQHVWAKLF